MTGGDAYPFESDTTVQPDGTYEFHNIPGGDYQMEAGATGWGSRITSDRELNPTIHWPDDDVPCCRSHFPHESELNEMGVRFLLGILHRAQTDYAERYGQGFVSNLNLLGPPPSWYRPSADRAGLLDVGKAGLVPGDDSTHLTDDGYRMTYIPGQPDSHGKITSFAISARPIEFGATGVHSFLIDEHGDIHATSADRPPTLHDPVVQDQ